MGLDWVLKARAVEGQEAEFSRLRDESLRIDGILSDKWREWLAAQEDKDSVKDYQAFLAAYPDLWDELVRVRAAKDKVTLSHYAVLDCPRIGIDPEATEWARQFYSDVFARRPNAPTLEAFLAEEHGKYVPDLAKNPEGLGKVTGIGAGPESFRGKIIGYADAVIGEQLAHRAYQDMDPDEMEDYADELEAAVKDWRSENEEKINRYMDLIGRLETDHKADSDVGEALDICDDVANAVTWLRFWAGHGFSVHAWY